MGGRLLLCATPIGNLGDITVRALEVLRSADVVYAEDTRHTRILLDHYQIRRPLRSCHDHNEAQRGAEVCDRIRQGQTVVYVSDAGTPGIADPGARLLEAVTSAGLAATVLPGPSALITAVTLCGLDRDGHFAFHGFPPRRSGQRRAHLAAALAGPLPAVWFEAPGRLVDTLAAICAVGGGQRPAAVARELTKIHEEVRRDTVEALAVYFTEHPARGEIVLCVAPGAEPEPGWVEAVAAVRRRQDGGQRLSSAVAEEAAQRGLPRGRLYRAVLEESGEKSAGRGDPGPPPG